MFYDFYNVEIFCIIFYKLDTKFIVIIKIIITIIEI